MVVQMLRLLQLNHNPLLHAQSLQAILKPLILLLKSENLQAALKALVVLLKTEDCCGITLNVRAHLNRWIVLRPGCVGLVRQRLRLPHLRIKWRRDSFATFKVVITVPKG
jgi:hypothetical protein